MTFRPRLALAIATVFTVAALVGAAAPAMAAVTCPNANPVVNENNCMGAGSQGWRLGNFSEDIAGYTTQTSFAKGASVPLKIARNAPILPQTRVDITVYRTGYYGGDGARLIPAPAPRTSRSTTTSPATRRTPRRASSAARTGPSPTRSPAPRCPPPASTWPSCARPTRAWRTTSCSWSATTTASPSRDVLLRPADRDLPAYNNWGGKSLYCDKNGGADTVSGTDRAVKVSFDRPLRPERQDRDRYFGPGLLHGPVARAAGLRRLLHRGRRSHQNPGELLEHKVVVIPGHSEYWSLRAVPQPQGRARRRRQHRLLQRQHRATGRSATRTAARTLVCYKTVQGAGSGGSGAITRQRLGPGRPVRAPPTTRSASTGSRAPPTTSPRTPPRPSATTARPPATRTRPTGGRVGPDMPENSALRRHVLRRQRQHRLPADRPRRQRQRRVRRRPHLAQHRAPDERRDRDRHGHRRLGVGRRPDPGPVPRAAARRASSG